MKVSCAVALLSSAVNGVSLDQLIEQVNKVIPPGMATANRALTEQSMGLLANYGCWCYFEANHGKGKGRPTDQIDSFCQGLHQGYECIKIDYDQAGLPCDPTTEPYVASAGFNLSEQDVIDQCDANNPVGTCSADACKVEGWFVQRYLTFTLSGGSIDQSKRHENGFDVGVECPISQGIKSEKACCGTYPSRFSFKDYNGARSCCSGSTYNTLMFACCNDGTIRTSCS